MLLLFCVRPSVTNQPATRSRAREEEEAPRLVSCHQLDDRSVCQHAACGSIQLEHSLTRTAGTTTAMREGMCIWIMARYVGLVVPSAQREGEERAGLRPAAWLLASIHDRSTRVGARRGRPARPPRAHGLITCGRCCYCWPACARCMPIYLSIHLPCLLAVCLCACADVTS